MHTNLSQSLLRKLHHTDVERTKKKKKKKKVKEQRTNGGLDASGREGNDENSCAVGIGG
jgi:hypothetical protein